MNPSRAIAAVALFADRMPASESDVFAQRVSAGVAAGDEPAFRELYDAYAPRLRRFVLALGRGDGTLADEIVQQVLLTAARKLRCVESEAHLWNWLARVARQHLGKIWRKQRREGTPLPLEAGTELAAEAAVDRRLEQALAAAMLGLDDDERFLLRRFYEERVSQQDLAAELGTTAKGIANRLDRLRTKLRARTTERLRHEEP